jgi:hypothetical protein
MNGKVLSAPNVLSQLMRLTSNYLWSFKSDDGQVQEVKNRRLE